MAVIRDPCGILILRDIIDNSVTTSAEGDTLVRYRKILYFQDGQPVYEKIIKLLEKKWHIVGYDDVWVCQ